MKERKFTKILRFKALFIKLKLPAISKGLDLIYRIVFSCDIPSSVVIGKGCKFAHSGLGCIFHPRVHMGENCKIFQNTTIGTQNGYGPPILGNNVYVGTGACILGDIKIGNNVKIGAHAVVLVDVPDNCTVLGIPGEIFKENS
ncbi:serine acetyltransferase [Neobacillus sp. NPDC093182]|uniref:serine acetyltransferase n=1 Tax=Neobacillus sp. NPDC093182 TaxID=3364297 RepID=UPI00381C57D1